MNDAGQRISPGAWPLSVSELEDVQRRLGEADPPLWVPEGRFEGLAGCFVCFPSAAGGDSGRVGDAGARRLGSGGDPGWAAAALLREGQVMAIVSVQGQAAAAYDPGHLALREGPLLEAAVRALPERPEVLLVNATGRDHPRRAGLALHLGARLDLPTVGVTNRLLQASGDWPEDRRGATRPFRLGTETVGAWLRSRANVRPLAVHAAWRTDVGTALAVVQACLGRARTPEPLRWARRAAREARQSR